MPRLKRLADAIDATNDWIGRGFAWLTLGMVLTEFVVVLSRYVFGLGSTIMQESIVYMHATVFLVCAGYALVHNGHVRCDIFYATMAPRTRALVDILGTLVFLLPTCLILAWLSWPFFMQSYAVLEHFYRTVGEQLFGARDAALGHPSQGVVRVDADTARVEQEQLRVEAGAPHVDLEHVAVHRLAARLRRLERETREATKDQGFGESLRTLENRGLRGGSSA